ncbi:MAG: hypothetical protein M5U30_18905 [Burkholderiaceae bacterium]|nr:hypothetical protein [Burkholderiaceae bacterium]
MADLARFQFAVAQQAIDQRRLSDPRRTEQATGLAGGHQRANPVNALARHVADTDDVGLDPHAPDVSGHLLQFVRSDQVGLRQQHHGPDAALPDHHQVTLSSRRRLEIEVARLDDERDVDVRGDHLDLDVAPRDLSPEKRSPRKYAVDARAGCRIPVADADPVAHAGKVFRRLREMQ